jgi:hypothetical protein
VFTDNFPLDEGKIHVREGGIRVPFLVSGPSVQRGVESQVVVNGLDFYPTILDWTGTSNSANQTLDGSNLAPLLKEDPTDENRVIDIHTKKPRESMFWHFPNGHCQQSAHLKDGYKLIYNHIYERPRVELYQLYDSSGNRLDWEEQKDISPQRPKLAEQMKQELLKFLKGLDAGMTYYNPTCTRIKIPGSKNVPQVLNQKRINRRVFLSYEEKGAKVTRAQVIYTLNGDRQDSEWFPLEAKVIAAKGKQPAKAVAVLPPRTTHYLFHLIDENNFMVSYPKLDRKDLAGTALQVSP